MSRRGASSAHQLDYAPMIAFTFAYLVFDLIGMVALLIDYKPIVAPFEYFTGTVRPHLGPAQYMTALALVFASPMLVWVGYFAGQRTPLPHRVGALQTRPGCASPWYAHVCFYVLAAFALASIIRANAFGNLETWLSYDNWITARQQTFDSISFVAFVAIYLLVPLAAGWVALATRGRGLRLFLARWIPSVIAVTISLLLFQKRPALIIVLLIMTSWSLYHLRNRVRRLSVTMTSVILIAAAMYLVMIVVPTFTRVTAFVSATSIEALFEPGKSALDPPNASTGVSASVDRLPLAVHIALYAALGPVMRTSAPALYYPVVFPDVHPLYGLDLGLDVLCSRRIGCTGRGMPNDNIVVWDYMNPGLPGGLVAAPFQFVLYSQVGVLGALLGSVVCGMLLAFAWRIAMAVQLARIWSSLLGSLVIVLSVYLTVDSVRNSLIVSYGVVWGAVFVLGAAGLVHLSESRARRSTKD